MTVPDRWAQPLAPDVLTDTVTDAQLAAVQVRILARRAADMVRLPSDQRGRLSQKSSS